MYQNHQQIKPVTLKNPLKNKIISNRTKVSQKEMNKSQGSIKI